MIPATNHLALLSHSPPRCRAGVSIEESQMTKMVIHHDDDAVLGASSRTKCAAN